MGYDGREGVIGTERKRIENTTKKLKRHYGEGWRDIEKAEIENRDRRRRRRAERGRKVEKVEEEVEIGEKKRRVREREKKAE